MAFPLNTPRQRQLETRGRLERASRNRDNLELRLDSPEVARGLDCNSRAITHVLRAAGVVVVGMCLIALIGRPGRRGTGLVGVLNEAAAAAEHGFGAPVMQCES